MSYVACMSQIALVGGEPAERLERILQRFTISQTGDNAYRIRGRLPAAQFNLLGRALKAVEAELASADPRQLGLRPGLVSPEHIETTAFTLLVVRVADAMAPNVPS
jgi:hypothetical protein